MEEERHMNKSLCQNQSEWQAKIEKSQKEMEATQIKKDTEIKELQDQVRDLMFYMEAQQKIAGSPLCQEIQDGELMIPESGETNTTNETSSTPRNGRGSSGGTKPKRRGR